MAILKYFPRAELAEVRVPSTPMPAESESRLARARSAFISEAC